MLIVKNFFLLALVFAISKFGLSSKINVFVGEKFGVDARRRAMVRIGLLRPGQAEFVEKIEASSLKLPQFDQIDRIDPPSAEDFERLYAVTGKPVVLTKAAEHWPALKWTLDSLRNEYGQTQLAIRKGSDYDSMVKELRTVAEYIDVLKLGTDFYMANNSLPIQMAKDVGIPNYFSPKQYDRESTRLWIGGEASGAHLHRDMVDNFIAQIFGKKIVYICAPHEAAKLKTWELNEYLHSSKEDLKSPDTQKKVFVYKVTLEPGDMLYIPCGWFHQIHNVGLVCSINFFIRDSAAVLTNNVH